MSEVIKNNPMGKVNVFGCGGTGCKIAAKFQAANGKANKSESAEISTFYLDTSRSDLPKGVDTHNCLILSDADGSGKIRGHNVDAIRGKIRQAPEVFGTGDLNIIVGSLVGGSGSVIAPLLASELAQQGKSVVFIGIGSDESLIAVTNVLNTLRTLDGVSSKNKIDLVLSFLDNGANTNLAEVDDEAVYQIAILAALANRQHVGLDTSDLRNFFHFSRATGIEPQVGTLHIRNSSTEAEDVLYPIAIASMVTGATDIGRLNADYQCVGYMSDSDLYGKEKEHHFLISVNLLPEIVKSYTARQDELKKRAAARPTVKRISIEDTDDDGMVV